MPQTSSGSEETARNAGRLGLRTSLAVALAVVAVFAAACARNPVTGRPEAVLTTEGGEIKQGNELAKTVEEEVGFVDDEEVEAYIDRLGQRLAAQSPRSHLTHRFHVLKLKEPNAFALPGGHIYVSEGLLVLVNSEDELATVVGHEIGHVAARHSVSRQTANAPLAPVRILAGIGGAAASIVSPSIGKIVSGVGQLPGALALAAYSRDQEREADRLGQTFGAAEGFDPASLSKFMDTLAREEELAGGDPNRGSFFRSHPPSPERSKAAIEHAATLEIANVTPAPLDRAEFLAILDGLHAGPPASEGVFVDERFLHADLGVSMSFPPDWETVNAPTAVAAIQKDELGQVVMQIVAEDSDPMEQALVLDREIALDGTPTRIEVGGQPAARAEVEFGGRSSKMRALMTWIEHDDRIYQISGVTDAKHFQSLRPSLLASANSFHPMTAAERAEVRQDTLRIATARKSEDLAALGERTKNRWSIEQTAVANGVEPEGELPTGMLVKIAVAEPYVAKPANESDGAGQ